MKRSDLTGERFGRLSVISLTNERCRQQRVWLCVCDCGKQKKVGTSQLRAGNNQSCGCLRRKSLLNLIGQRFGLLTVSDRSNEVAQHSGHAIWLCKCDCGNTTTVSSSTLRSGRVKSCGCLRAELSSERARMRWASIEGGDRGASWNQRHSVESFAKMAKSRFYPHSSIEEVANYLTMKHATRKVEECLTQTK